MALPDLSRLEESVQAQLRERYAALTEKQNNPATPAADLATEYGEMGKLLLAAEFRDPAEASLLNAQALAPGDMRWPYYLGHLYRTKRRHPERDGRLRAGAAVGARRRADDDLARRGGSRSGTTGRRGTASSRKRCRFSLARSRRIMASDARRWPERITREPRRISNRRWRSTTRHRSSTIRWRWRTVAWATARRRNRTCSNAARCRFSPTR